MQLIPAIDLLDGKVVRLTQGDYSQVETYAKDPIELAQWYEELGAERIHLVDLDGAKNGSLTNISILKEIRKKTDCILEVGGGIRDKESASRLINLGINHLILGSLLIKNWALSCDMITENPNIFIAGIDVKDETVAVQGWIEKSNTFLTDLIKKCNNLPLESIIVTDIATDGMLQGPNISLLKKASQHSIHPVIASGGITQENDIHTLSLISNIKGCIIGKALLSGLLNTNILTKKKEL